MVGYRVTEHLRWLDAFLNASMLFGGMGPVDEMHTDGGKLFAGIYALVCGLVIVAATGLLLGRSCTASSTPCMRTMTTNKRLISA